jgi:ribosome-binding factor A
MTIHRPSRVAEQIQGELARILRTDVKDPRVAPVTITHVHVSADLKHARVHLVPLGGQGSLEETLEGLEKAASWLGRQVGTRLGLRYAPKLRFVEDDGLEESIRMTEMLARMEQERKDRERKDREGGDK